MPPGNQSGQAGAAVPLYGESEIRQQSSGVDVLTITGHSSMAAGADFLALRGNVPEGSTIATTERFVVGSSGQLRTHQKLVVAHSTVIDGNSTLGALSATNSGQVHTYGGFSSGLTVALPAAAAGLMFTIVQEGAMAGALTITSTAGGDIRAPFLASGLSTGQAVTPPTTVAGMAAVFLAVNATTWQMLPAINGIQGSSAVGSISGCWIAGSTIA